MNTFRRQAAGDVVTALQIDLRRATPADAPAIRQLVREAYAKWVPLLGREPEPMTVDYDRAVRQHQIDLAYSNGALVALIEVMIKPDHLFVENIAVAPDHQGKGLGRFLLNHADARAQEWALPEIRLLTAQEMAGNIRLYRSVGYRLDQTVPFKNGFRVYMSKSVNPA